MVHIASLNILETRKVCCHCWDSNPRLFNSLPSHYTSNPVPVPKRVHSYLLYCLVERSHGLAIILTCKLIRTKLASQNMNVHCLKQICVKVSLKRKCYFFVCQMLPVKSKSPNKSHYLCCTLSYWHLGL